MNLSQNERAVDAREVVRIQRKPACLGRHVRPSSRSTAQRGASTRGDDDELRCPVDLHEGLAAAKNGSNVLKQERPQKHRIRADG